jgi:hypothetical protein
MSYGWQRHYEICAKCRYCTRFTIFKASQRHNADSNHLNANEVHAINGSTNKWVEAHDYVSAKDADPLPAPESLPPDIAAAFEEGCRCWAIGCFNAAATMFRLSLDLATKPLLPPEDADGGPNGRQRRDLGLRLPWLFDNGKLPNDQHLRDLSHCVKEDGNDGAHAGNLTNEDAADLYDFAFALLDRIITEPHRVRLAIERREARRAARQ